MTIRHRRGTTLIQMLVMISMLSTVFVGVAGIIRKIIVAEAALRDQREQQVIHARLRHTWRTDAHAAQDAILLIPPAKAQLELRLPESQSISYSCASGEIHRVKWNGENAVHQEHYRFPGSTFEIRLTEDKPRMLVLEIRSPADVLTKMPGGKGNLPKDVRQLEAVLGKDVDHSMVVISEPSPRKPE